MVNLTPEMAQLWASLGPPAPGRGKVVQFAAAVRGEGVSTVAREFARFAAGRARRPVWLIDLDLLDGRQSEEVAADPARYGPLGKATAATPDGSMFFAVEPAARDRQGRLIPDGNYLCAHQVARTRLWVTRFRSEMLKAGQGPELKPSADYWNAMRAHAEWVVVDAPASERSMAAAEMAPYVDTTVLVVAAEGADTRPPAVLRDTIEEAGGRCAGIFFNRARIAPPSFLKGILP
jgi:Mrp family chromosome partitioning ATPase